MSEDTTTTDAPANDGAPVQDVSTEAQPEVTETAEAVQSTEEPAETTQPDTNGIEDWAEKKGLKLDNHEDVKKAFANFRQAEQKMHESTTQASELKNVINEEVQAQASTLPEGDDLAAMKLQMQRMQAEQAVNDFYQQNPDARQFDDQMAKIATERGIGDIEALYALAKLDQAKNGGNEQLKKEGGREALEGLAQKQKAASPSPSATTMEAPSQGVTVAEVGERTRAGDVQWLREHAAEIDAL